MLDPPPSAGLKYPRNERREAAQRWHSGDTRWLADTALCPLHAIAVVAVCGCVCATLGFVCCCMARVRRALLAPLHRRGGARGEGEERRRVGHCTLHCECVQHWTLQGSGRVREAAAAGQAPLFFLAAERSGSPLGSGSSHTWQSNLPASQRHQKALQSLKSHTENSNTLTSPSTVHHVR